MVEEGRLAGRLVTFAYEDGGGAYRPRPAPDAHIRIGLTPDELRRKQQVVRDIYDFQSGSFEFDSAGSVEAFNVPEPGGLRDVKSLLGG